MAAADKNLAVIWRQTQNPVVYRQGGGKPLMVKLPYAPGNGDWLRNDQHRKPEWVKQYKCWETPKAWFENVVRRTLQRYDRVYVIQPYRAQEKCAPACWNATGIECECSCMGANHGSGSPLGKWHVVSDTFAVQWHDRQLARRLIERPQAH